MAPAAWLPSAPSAASVGIQAAHRAGRSGGARLLAAPHQRPLPPLGSSVLEPDLDSRLVEAQLVGELAPSVGVRIWRLLKCGLEHRELVIAEHCPVWVARGAFVRVKFSRLLRELRASLGESLPGLLLLLRYVLTACCCWLTCRHLRETIGTEELLTSRLLRLMLMRMLVLMLMLVLMRMWVWMRMRILLSTVIMG